MSGEQAKPDKKVSEKEAQSRLRAFEVGIGHICNGLGIEYDEFAKQANAAFKFAKKDEDAAGVLAPWLVDQIVAQAVEAEQQPQA